MNSQEICKEYQNFLCVSELGEYKERFIFIVNAYAGRLNQKIMLDGSVFTLHDFNNHCFNLYKIISGVLLNRKYAYSRETGLTPIELYILDLAVLFHDISMSEDMLAERTNHSKRSADYVNEEYKNTSSMFYQKSGLNKNEVDALMAIITAHSDVKDGSVSAAERGLNSPDLINDIPAKSGKIRVKLLAGLLRIADELDISIERLGNTDIECRLGQIQEKYNEMLIQKESEDPDLDENQYAKVQGYVESLKHWEFLHYFSQVIREDQGETIWLVTDDKYVQGKIDAGESPVKIARILSGVYSKIKEEWEAFYETVIHDPKHTVDNAVLIPAKDIGIRCGVENVFAEVKLQMDNDLNVKKKRFVSLPEEKKTCQVTVFSPVNVNVYLEDKEHIVLYLDRNSGFDYERNSIAVGEKFTLIFSGRSFEKKITFERPDNCKFEYRLNAVLSREEVESSYDRESAIEQIRKDASGYSFDQLAVAGEKEDIRFLYEWLSKKSFGVAEEDLHRNFLIAKCAVALGKLCIKYRSFEYADIIRKVFDKYEAKKSYGYYFENILKVVSAAMNEEFLQEHLELFQKAEDGDPAAQYSLGEA